MMADRSPSLAERVAELRPAYLADLAEGTDRFFEPPATVCPWCGGGPLTRRLRTTDLFQHKPGRFTLDACDACGHVFQNPRLSLAGLEFYYRDFYDGLGEKQLDGLFDSSARSYRGRAALFAAHADEPKNWLDVGTGHGHFPRAATAVLPHTAFDGLDLTAGVELAAERGWIERGYRGQFVELADTLADGYEVVSMFHYLEHSTDPGAELAAAARVVRPGGHLMIEVPDPECRSARLLGRWWMPWLQPQHLHFVPLANLRERLRDLGFTVVAEQRGEPHSPIELVATVWMVASAMAPKDDRPWFPARPGRGRRALRAVVSVAAVVPLLLAHGIDVALRPFAGHARLSNAYRVLAQKSGR